MVILLRGEKVVLRDLREEDIRKAHVRKARIVRGEYYDAIKMGILREEWESTGTL